MACHWLRPLIRRSQDISTGWRLACWQPWRIDGRDQWNRAIVRHERGGSLIEGLVCCHFRASLIIIGKTWLKLDSKSRGKRYSMILELVLYNITETLHRQRLICFGVWNKWVDGNESSCRFEKTIWLTHRAFGDVSMVLPHSQLRLVADANLPDVPKPRINVGVFVRTTRAINESVSELECGKYHSSVSSPNLDGECHVYKSPFNESVKVKGAGPRAADIPLGAIFPISRNTYLWISWANEFSSFTPRFNSMSRIAKQQNANAKNDEAALNQQRLIDKQRILSLYTSNESTSLTWLLFTPEVRVPGTTNANITSLSMNSSWLVDHYYLSIRYKYCTTVVCL